MKVEAARLMVYTAAARAESREPNLGFIASASKCFASDVAMEVTTDAVQLFGGAGYTQDFPVERMMRDAKITQIYEGTNQIQRVVMSNALLKQLRCLSGGLAGLANELARQLRARSSFNEQWHEVSHLAALESGVCLMNHRRHLILCKVRVLSRQPPLHIVDHRRLADVRHDDRLRAGSRIVKL